MIKLMRLDERFIHGQVAFAWTNSLGANCIFVANDAVGKDDLRQTSLKLATPPGCKFVAKTMDEAIRILNGDKIKKYNVFVLVDNTADALKICENVSEIKQVNLGNMKMKEGRSFITNSIAVDADDCDHIRTMASLGVVVECRALPTDKKVLAIDLINKK